MTKNVIQIVSYHIYWLYKTTNFKHPDHNCDFKKVYTDRYTGGP